MLAACTHGIPLAVYPSNLPGPMPENVPMYAVTARLCQPFLFGIWALKRPFTMGDLVTDAAGTDELVQLYGITTTRTNTNWVLGYTTCTSLHAWTDAAPAVPPTMTTEAASLVEEYYLATGNERGPLDADLAAAKLLLDWVGPRRALREITRVGGGATFADTCKRLMAGWVSE
jgi:hypothetical protein